jgi:hypothetical protein
MPITVDGCTFELTQALAASFVTQPAVEADNQNVGYIGTGKESTVPAYVLTPGEMQFTATLQTLAGRAMPLGQFKLGFVQNVTVYQRNATYDNDYTLSEQFQYAPIRDGEISELPFSYNGTKVATQVQDSIAIQNDDGPKWEIPQQINGGNLVSTGGSNTLVTWLALVRDVADQRYKKMLLLGKAQWTVSFTTQMQNGQLQFVGNPQSQVVLTPLNVVMTPTGTYPVGTGYDWPDLRREASGNDYIYGQWYVDGNTSNSNRWSYDENGDAIEFKKRVDPVNFWSWLTNQPTA